VLQIVMEPEALGRQVFADDRHREVGAVLAAVFFWQRVAIVPRLVGAPAHLAEQSFPFMAQQAVALEVGARPFAAMVEKADVVVFAFERLDFFLDERVQLGQVGCYVGRNIKIHGVSPQAMTLCARRTRVWLRTEASWLALTRLYPAKANSAHRSL